MSAFYIVRDRYVLTYQPDEWPIGLLTGYEDGSGGWALEHVVVFNGAPVSTMMDMLRAGIEEAWKRDFQYITWWMPAAFPSAQVLAELGRRLGFERSGGDGETSVFIKHREAV